MTVKSAKAKARRLQDYTRDLLLSTYPDLERDTDVRAAIMGESGTDVILSKAARKHFPYSIECKAYKNPQVQPWFEQSMSNKYDDTEALLIVKGDRKEPLVVIRMEHFMELIK